MKNYIDAIKKNPGFVFEVIKLEIIKVFQIEDQLKVVRYESLMNKFIDRANKYFDENFQLPIDIYNHYSTLVYIENNNSPERLIQFYNTVDAFYNINCNGPFAEFLTNMIQTLQKNGSDEELNKEFVIEESPKHQAIRKEKTERLDKITSSIELITNINVGN